MILAFGNVVLRIAFSPDGKQIASISWDGTVRIWGIAEMNLWAGIKALDLLLLTSDKKMYILYTGQYLCGGYI